LIFFLSTLKVSSTIQLSCFIDSFISILYAYLITSSTGRTVEKKKNNSHCEIVTSGFDSSAQFDWKNELRCHDSLECLIPSTNAFLVEIASLRSDRNAYHSSPFDHSLMWFQFDFSENEILCHFVTGSKTTKLI
jgi:hypothetical protein